MKKFVNGIESDLTEDEVKAKRDRQNRVYDELRAMQQEAEKLAEQRNKAVKKICDKLDITIKELNLILGHR